MCPSTFNLQQKEQKELQQRQQEQEERLAKVLFYLVIQFSLDVKLMF